MMFNFPVVGMGAVRMTQRDKWKENAKRYMAYKSRIQWHIKDQLPKDYETLKQPIRVILHFYMPLPQNGKSRNKEVFEGDYHTITPDVDNLIKGMLDSCNKMIWSDDCYVVEVAATKRYSKAPYITMEIEKI